jgi:hypothetical protein
MYDSTKDTQDHIDRVNYFLIKCCKELEKRGLIHDKSKLESPEKEYFDEFTPLMKDVEYGSNKAKALADKIRPALKHHYANNSHHPQYYENGIDGMNLFDLMEMFVDWRASTERSKNGDINRSIEIAKERYKISDQLTSILKNTVKYFEND